MEGFEAMAQDYDTDERIARSKAIADIIRGHLTDGQAKSAIEYGCGTGLVGIELIDEFDSLLMVDNTNEMILQARQKLSELNTQKATALCCDFMEEIPDGLKADYIFASLVLHHIKDTKEILRRLRGVLNDNGHLLIVDVDKEDGSFHAKYTDYDGHNGFDHHTLSSLAKKAGFSNVTIGTFYRGAKIHNGKQSPYSLFILDAMK